jgi:hypothetical protein
MYFPSDIGLFMLSQGKNRGFAVKVDRNYRCHDTILIFINTEQCFNITKV